MTDRRYNNAIKKFHQQESVALKCAALTVRWGDGALNAKRGGDVRDEKTADKASQFLEWISPSPDHLHGDPVDKERRHHNNLYAIHNSCKAI